jgi:HD-GYP domain-containing protein (c-di-GMP phosphodiesterase class II)
VTRKLTSLATERRLKEALASIDALSNFGESLLEVLEPEKYDCLVSLDLIVEQVLRNFNKFPGQPERILMGWRNTQGTWRWFFYEVPFGQGQRQEFFLSPEEAYSLIEGGESLVFFANGEDWSCATAALLKKILESRYLAVQNLVAYRSRRLAVFALNYGEPVSEIEALVLKSLATQGLFLVSMADQIEATEDAFAYAIRSLARATEMNDDDTGNHVLRVGRYSAFLAQKLGLPERFVKTIAVAAQIHDVGKVKLSPEILRKPVALSAAEWELNRQHPRWGADIIGFNPRLAMARQIALTHHEKWDGSGYPQGLKGNEIPLEGRIVALADAYDALRNPRAYKRSYPHEEAVWIMTKGDGRTKPDHFDPAILRIFRDNHERFAGIYEDLGDETVPAGR